MERLPEHCEVVAAEVVERLCKLVIVPPADEASHVPRIIAGVGEPFPKPRRGDPEQPLIDLVGHLVDGHAKKLAIWLGESCLKLLAVFGVDDIPAVGVEHLPPCANPDSGDDTIQALSVHINDPEDFGEVVHDRLCDGLPDRSFVQLGVPDY